VNDQLEIVSDLFVETLGDGAPVILVHGSLATSSDEWQAQRPLAEQGFRLLVVDRRGYANSPAAEGEDFLRDGEDIASLMGDGAHLVGHSYGGLGALVAAARRPKATLSLTLLEPGAFGMGQHHPAARAFTTRIREIWHQDLPDEAWCVEFLKAVGSDPEMLGPELLAAAMPLVRLVRRGRPIWELDLPFAEMRQAAYPKVVVSGGHSAGIDAICDDLAARIGAERAVVAGAGHEVQFAGAPINDLLLRVWRSVQRVNISSNTR
jgi:pimeloyl-ACP methyl ester carboxylesterase